MQTDGNCENKCFSLVQIMHLLFISHYLYFKGLALWVKGDIIIHSHQIQSVGCWIPCALGLGGHSCEWCGASCCCHPSSSLCLGPHRVLCWRVLGNPPRSDGVGHRSGVAPCKAAPSPIDHDKDPHVSVWI